MGKKSKGKKKERKRALLLAAAAETAQDVPNDRAGVVAATGAGLDETPAPARRSIDAGELAARLASLSTVLQRHLSRAEAGEGLTRARLSALALLVLGGPRTLGDLAAAEHVRPPTMTRLVHAMEADGLVSRLPNPDDARSVVIRATTKGEQQLELGRARQIAPLAGSIASLDRSERLQLEDAADLLGRVLRESTWEPADSDA
jgi:DNA-binding MarR family transcriptional regulator